MHTRQQRGCHYRVGSCEKVPEKESDIMKVKFKRIILASVQNGLEAGVRQEDLQGSYYSDASQPNRVPVFGLFLPTPQ